MYITMYFGKFATNYLQNNNMHFYIFYQNTKKLTRNKQTNKDNKLTYY